jgi:hypothetical protein
MCERMGHSASDVFVAVKRGNRIDAFAGAAGELGRRFQAAQRNQDIEAAKSNDRENEEKREEQNEGIHRSISFQVTIQAQSFYC